MVRASRVWTTTLRYGYGQFYLLGGGPAPAFDFDLARVVERAIDAGGIAQQDSFVVVLSPKERSSGMALRVEVWPDEPPDDGAAWPEGFVGQIQIHRSGSSGKGALILDSVEWNNRRSFDVEPGLYQLCISGRGFDRDGDGTEEWRVQLSPAGLADVPNAQSPPPRRTSAYQPPPVVRPAPELREAGVAAVRRIHRDLDEERSFSGERVTVTVERALAVARKRLFDRLRYPLWLTSAGELRPNGFMLEGVNEIRRHSEGELFADERKIVACNGLIEGEHLDGQEPAFTVSTWVWLRLPPEGVLPQARDGRPGAILVSSDPPVTLRFDLEQAGTDRQPVTTVRVSHSGVPIEWDQDLTAYWKWMLERLDYDFDLVKR